MTFSQDPLCNANKRKTGYIMVMKELSEQKGYGHLGSKGQNLSDQASRLERAQECSVDNSTYSANGTSVMDIDEIDQPEYSGVAGSVSLSFFAISSVLHVRHCFKAMLLASIA